VDRTNYVTKLDVKLVMYIVQKLQTANKFVVNVLVKSP